ncbi:hypothetical protein [Oxalobacter paraformigenes]|uniref:hypothetical protein n=1 Tax=Oxalobacter paraformigenes TaxID=556268 RepID=UPI00059305DF|nr:hypothetical protein [Oxalobacter paraformigenes]
MSNTFLWLVLINVVQRQFRVCRITPEKTVDLGQFALIDRGQFAIIDLGQFTIIDPDQFVSCPQKKHLPEPKHKPSGFIIFPEKNRCPQSGTMAAIHAGFPLKTPSLLQKNNRLDGYRKPSM